MNPNQDYKVDIWSLGCLLVELYTGQKLFSVNNDVEHLCVIEKICGHFPEHMTDNSLNKEVKTIFINCEKHQDKTIQIKKCNNYRIGLT